MNCIGNTYTYNNITGIVVDEDSESRCVLLRTCNGVELFISYEELKKWDYVEHNNTTSTLPAKASVVKNSNKTNIKVDKILDYLFEVTKNMGAEIYTPKSNIKMRMFKIHNHLFMKVSYSKYSIKIYCRSIAVKNIYKPDLIQNHMFDYVYVVNTLTKKTQELINYLIKVSMDYQIQKDK